MLPFINVLCTIHTEKLDCTLAGVAQWVECQPVNQKVTGLIPSQGTCLGHRPDPGWGAVRGSQMIFLSHINVSLPLFLSPFRSKNK